MSTHIYTSTALTLHNSYLYQCLINDSITLLNHVNVNVEGSVTVTRWTIETRYCMYSIVTSCIQPHTKNTGMFTSGGSLHIIIANNSNILTTLEVQSAQQKRAASSLTSNIAA